MTVVIDLKVPPTKETSPSIEARYPDHSAYVRKVSNAARRLVHKRLLLREDAWRITSAAAEATSWGYLVPIAVDAN